MKKQFRSFTNAKKFVRSLKLSGKNSWEKYRKTKDKPDDIPTNPQSTYKKEWVSWGDWLGTGNLSSKEINKSFRPFKKSKLFVQSLNLKSGPDWKEYCKSDKRSDDIPTNPNVVYKNKGWKSMGDWLGTGYIATRNRQYLQFTEARKYVHTLKIPTQVKWFKFCKSNKKPDNIPTDPHKKYEKEWGGWSDWLGSGRITNKERSKKFLPFSKARQLSQKIAKENNITTLKDWQQYIKTHKLPDGLSTNPNRTYNEKGWRGWPDWLGANTVSNKLKSQNWLPWPEAKLLYRKIKEENNLKNFQDWQQYIKTHKLPDGLSAYPQEIYTQERIQKEMKKK